MRPDLLEPLFRPMSSLEGVGAKSAALFDKLLLKSGDVPPARIKDLLFLRPSYFIDRTQRLTIQEAFQKKSSHENSPLIATLNVLIEEHPDESSQPRYGKKPYKIIACDDKGAMSLVFFSPRRDYLLKTFPIGERRLISGKIEVWDHQIQMVHPDYAVSLDQADSIPDYEAIYPSTAGLSLKLIRKLMQQAFHLIPPFDEWQDQALKSKKAFPSFHDALIAIHQPSSLKESEQVQPLARQRLAYDELLASQLALNLMRSEHKSVKGIARIAPEGCLKRFKNALPFTLTPSQEQAISDGIKDLEKNERMLRLLQGDVGAGKTIVAFAMLYYCIQSGAQGAMMAPTEVLARQHYQSLVPLAQKLGIRIALLTGKDKAKLKQATLIGLLDGTIDLVIGTHALFQDSVNFKNLGLAIIDEQHRFGVEQRLKLAQKGKATDLLIMTATPIPRTLTMSWYGDMDVSKLTVKPKGRKPIDTRLTSLDRLSTVSQRLNQALSQGAKAYWICPLVEESDLSELTSVETRFSSLKKLMDHPIGLMHGQMSVEEKQKAMLDFQSGATRLLIATTVVEVGVDVPDATIMVIEHAERFGLSQLHQLRGRVGRGDAPSSCLLLYQTPLGAVSEQRLNIMCESEDGFYIAEEDLKLRGQGDIMGTKQSGVPGFTFVDFEQDKSLIETAYQDARLTIEKNPTLKSERGQNLKNLLYLFGRDEAVRRLKAG